MPRNPDVVVVGGGIVGCAIAYRLAKENLSVTLVEKGAVGREASWAAGGILTPIHLAEYPTPLADLCVASWKLYDPLVRELRTQAPTDPEYQTTGLLLLIHDDEDEKAAKTLEEWKRSKGQPVERISSDEARKREPRLAPSIRGALVLPDIAQVRNHRMTVALSEAAVKHGVTIQTDTEVTGFLRVPGRINGVKTTRGDVYAGATVVATGAWAGAILQSIGVRIQITPAKGQMLLTEAMPGFLRHMILSKDQYLIPRADGKILVGSTVEDAGFDKSVTFEGARFLMRRAEEMMPALSERPLLMSWAGLRPATPDRLPYIGPSPAHEKLLVAAGHFRNGILLAPVTAEMIAAMVLGRPSPVDPTPFRLDR